MSDWDAILVSKSLRSKFRKAPVLLDGRELSANDKDRVYDSYLMHTLLLIDFAAETAAVVQDLSRNLSPRSLVHGLRYTTKMDVAKLAEAYKALLAQFRLVPIDHDRSYHACKEWYRFSSDGVIKEYINQFVLPYLYAAWVNPSQRTLFVANTVLQFTSRLTLRDITWIEDETLAKYLQEEQRLSSLNYNEELLSELRDIVSNWLYDFELDAKPQHGYGATAEVGRSRGTSDKYRHMHVTRQTFRLASLFNWLPDNEAWGEISDALLLGMSGFYSDVDLISQYQLVPKGINKKRGICMEPVVNMFFQKMIFQSLDRHFRKHPEMHIDLHEQGHNRDLALEGSKTAAWCTIDLSNASDNVTYAIVDAITRDVPLLHDVLMDARTKRVKVGSGPEAPVINIAKFAPMGSACCFPVECLVFAACCELACRRR